MSENISKKQNILVISAALGVVIASVFITLYFSGSIDSVVGQSNNKGYQNVTFTDASLACEKAAKAQFGETLQTLVVDNHSSRFENRQFLYKIFLEADVKRKSDKQAILFYVNCFVRSRDGRISKFESFENKDDVNTPATDDGTNMFGWPK